LGDALAVESATTAESAQQMGIDLQPERNREE
jgi:hypothetical protein